MLTDHHLTATDQLWYRTPADGLLQALPLGNGRLGALIHGGVHSWCQSS